MAMPTTPILETLRHIAHQYETPQFIATDPLSLPYTLIQGHTGCQNPAHSKHFTLKCLTERIALTAAMMAYGNRVLLIKQLFKVLFPVALFTERTHLETHEALQGSPQTFFNTLLAWHKINAQHTLGYRFQTHTDVLWWLELMASLPAPQAGKTALVALWQKALHTVLTQDRRSNHEGVLALEEDAFFQRTLDTWVSLIVAYHPPQTYGQRYLLSRPSASSARKRLCLFLRWVVRTGCVDLGLWHPETTSLYPSHLRMPLDTHVAKQARLHGLLHRQSNDWQSVCQLTHMLRQGSPEDPLLYEFSLFAPFPKG